MLGIPLNYQILNWFYFLQTSRYKRDKINIPNYDCRTDAKAKMQDGSDVGK